MEAPTDTVIDPNLWMAPLETTSSKEILRFYDYIRKYMETNRPTELCVCTDTSDTRNSVLDAHPNRLLVVLACNGAFIGVLKMILDMGPSEMQVEIRMSELSNFRDFATQLEECRHCSLNVFSKVVKLDISPVEFPTDSDSISRFFKVASKAFVNLKILEVSGYSIEIGDDPVATEKLWAVGLLSFIDRVEHLIINIDWLFPVIVKFIDLSNCLRHVEFDSRDLHLDDSLVIELCEALKVNKSVTVLDLNVETMTTASEDRLVALFRDKHNTTLEQFCGGCRDDEIDYWCKMNQLGPVVANPVATKQDFLNVMQNENLTDSLAFDLIRHRADLWYEGCLNAPDTPGDKQA